MNKTMVARWNDTVKEDDLVFHLGDLSASLKDNVDGLQEVISSLRGKKIFVRGNHDWLTDDWYVNAGFKRVYQSISVGRVLLVHYPLEEALKRKVDDSSWGEIDHVVHGHIHKTDVQDFECHFNVAVDRHDFAPVTFEKVIPYHLQTTFMDAALSLL